MKSQEVKYEYLKYLRMDFIFRKQIKDFLKKETFCFLPAKVHAAITRNRKHEPPSIPSNLQHAFAQLPDRQKLKVYPVYCIQYTSLKGNQDPGCFVFHEGPGNCSWQIRQLIPYFSPHDFPTVSHSIATSRLD